MPYLEMVLKESMRLLPVTTVLSRQATEKVVLNGYTLPKNSLVLIAPWTLHRCPEYFPNPLCFDPERFHPRSQRQNSQVCLPSLFCGSSHLHWQCIRNDADANQFSDDFARLSANCRPWISIRAILQFQYSS
jgi:cytochrome P450